jgi:hypothetical protein
MVYDIACCCGRLCCPLDNGMKERLEVNQYRMFTRGDEVFKVKVGGFQ